MVVSNQCHTDPTRGQLRMETGNVISTSRLQRPAPPLPTNIYKNSDTTYAARIFLGCPSSAVEGKGDGRIGAAAGGGCMVFPSSMVSMTS